MISKRATYIFPSLFTGGSTKPALYGVPRTMKVAEALNLGGENREILRGQRKYCPEEEEMNNLLVLYLRGLSVAF